MLFQNLNALELYFYLFCRGCILEYLVGNCVSASSKVDSMLEDAECVESSFGHCFIVVDIALRI